MTNHEHGAAGANGPSISDLQNSNQPFVLADAGGLIVAINSAFEEAYGWTIEQLQGETLNKILPSSFHMSHQLGFSRFSLTGESQILAHPLRLKTVCHDGTERLSEHFIVAEKQGSDWIFGATLTPLDA